MPAIFRQLRLVPTLARKTSASGGDLRRGLVTAKLFYFFYFAAIGSLVPFLNVYFARLGLSGAQIGWLSSIAPLIALTANPFWGAVADRWQVHRWVLALCAFAAGLVSLFYLMVDSFWPLMVVVVVVSFFRTPIGSLVDSAVIDMVRRVGSSYGHQRMWGSVGFVLVTVVLGRVVAADDLQIAFWLHGLLLVVVCTWLGLHLPVTGRDGRVSLPAGLKRLVGQRSYMAFLGAMALLGMGTSSFVNFLGLQILELGGNEWMIGLAWAMNGAAEFPMMLFGSRWFGRVPHGRLIQVGFVGYALVWTLMALATAPLALVLASALNGFCYGTVWVAAVNYASEAAPPGLSATAQALVGAVQSGIGWSLGSVIAGYLWDLQGGPTVFLTATLAALAGVLVFSIGSRGLHGRPVD
jgi:PPP family 3-phenylpropionic acid transporter